jgi:hypothetical protein
MRKDVKIGMVIGSLIVISAIGWLSTHSSLTDLELSPGPQIQQKESQDVAGKSPPDSTTDMPDIPVATIKPRETLTFNKEITEYTETPLTRHKESEQAKHNRIHTVATGETLSGISQIYYGTASGWQKIYVTNRKVLSSPDRIRPGMRLIIPE